MSELQILRLPQVLKRVGLGKTTLYAAIKRGEFPKPIRLGERSVGWKLSDLEKWADSRPSGAA